MSERQTLGELPTMYRRRFGPDVEFRTQMWRVLCKEFFQKYVPTDSTVLEVGAGYCEFINNIGARRKIAVDLNSDTHEFAASGVEVIQTPSTDLSMIKEHSIDVAFASNFFEHLSRPDIADTLRELGRVLKPDGKLLILQPNIRFCYRDYWMFFDHITPLDDRSLAEVLETTGYRVLHMVVRFLPFTTKSGKPKSIALLRLYLKMPMLWRIFGQQTFALAEPMPHPR